MILLFKSDLEILYYVRLLTLSNTEEDTTEGYKCVPGHDVIPRYYLIVQHDYIIARPSQEAQKQPAAL